LSRSLASRLPKSTCRQMFQEKRQADMPDQSDCNVHGSISVHRQMFPQTFPCVEELRGLLLLQLK